MRRYAMFNQCTTSTENEIKMEMIPILLSRDMAGRTRPYLSNRKTVLRMSQHPMGRVPKVSSETIYDI